MTNIIDQIVKYRNQRPEIKLAEHLTYIPRRDDSAIVGQVAYYENPDSRLRTMVNFMEDFCIEFDYILMQNLAPREYKVIQESQRAIDYPPMQYSLNLPCVVKDKSKKGCVTQDMWCLDWLDDTEFLKDHADVRQLIFNSFASHGKVVRDSVNNKIGNTENNIRLLISHRNEGRSPCAARS